MKHPLLRSRWLLSALAALALSGPAPAVAQPASGPDATAPDVEVAPLIVKVHADWCAKCKAIAPTWARVESELADEARVVVLDVTDRDRAREAERLAAELGIGEFFAAHRAKTGTVAVFEAGAAEPSRVLVAEKDFAAYRAALDEVASS